MMNMEEIGNGLRIAELKKEAVVKICEELNKKSGDFLSFAMQWEELEEHFNGALKGIEDNFRELKDLEKEVNERVKVAESKESELASFEGKIKEYEGNVVKLEEKLGRLEKGVEEKSTELEENEKKLVLTRTAVDMFSSDIVQKKEEFSELSKSVEECSRDLSLKKGELDLVNRTLKEQSEEHGFKKYDLSSVESLLEDKRRNVDLENKKLASVQEKLGEYSKRLELTQRALEKCERNVDLKRKELQSLVNQIGCSCQIQRKEDHLKLIEQLYASTQMSIDVCSEEFDAKQKELDKVKMSLREFSKELESKQKELEFIEEKRSKQLQELELKEKDILSLEAVVKKQFEILECEHKQLEEQLKVLEVQRKWLLPQKESTKKHGREGVLKGKNVVLSPKLEEEVMEDPVSQGCMNATFQGPVNNELLGELPVCHASDSLAMVPDFEALNESPTEDEILDAIKTAEDPAKLVLDFIEGSYKKHHQRKVIGSLNDVVRTHLIFLKQLMIIEPPLTETVKEGAGKLAVEWKQRLDHANPKNLEVLRFLHLLAAYKLVSFFRKDEILRLVEIVSLYDQATELCHTLGFVKKITGSRASTSDPKANPHKRGVRRRGSKNAPIDIQAQSNKRIYTLRPH